MPPVVLDRFGRPENQILGWQKQYPANAPALPPREQYQPPEPAAVTPFDVLAAAIQEQNRLTQQLLITQSNVAELGRLNLMGSYGAPVTDRLPPVAGTTLTTAPNFYPLFKNDGRPYTIGVRVQVQWNTPGGWILLSKQLGTPNASIDFVQNGVTPNNQTSQIFLRSGETLFAAVQSAVNGGVVLSAADQIIVLITDPTNVMSGQERQWKTG